MADTYSTNTGPICPHCGTENDSAGNDYWAEEQGSGTTECVECEKKFFFVVDFTTHYYAYKPKDDLDELVDKVKDQFTDPNNF